MGFCVMSHEASGFGAAGFGFLAATSAFTRQCLLARLWQGVLVWDFRAWILRAMVNRFGASGSFVKVSIIKVFSLRFRRWGFYTEKTQ